MDDELLQEAQEPHYGSLRRFLPLWYETIHLVPNTAEDSVIRGLAFLRKYAEAGLSTLPPHGVPTSFLSPKWKKRALQRNPWRDEILRVNKASYELGLLDAIVRRLSEGSLAVEGARRYGPLTGQLISRQEFLQNYHRYLDELGRPASAAVYYEGLKEELTEWLECLGQAHSSRSRRFYISKRGELGFRRPPRTYTPRGTKALRRRLQGLMPKVTIVDLLLDCHRLTGFLDCLRPQTGRQNMPDAEKVLLLIGALLSYGCNFGPSQASEALGLSKQQVLYIKRHYMGIKQLSDGSSILERGYGPTNVAARLGMRNRLTPVKP